ncbi:prepilin-type N-terminal cleavage/methylation domain-containing protein [Candidatus Sumerlaeota bacterium]|nr:prepilin-type N-terminal cleavage/methylation domain-containing protein [Candidatus Sumerlaeota bacterium]
MREERGFTLIELLIVVAIIAILAAIAVPNFLEAQVRAKISRVKTDMRTLAVAMEAYRQDWTDYPPDRGNYGNREYPSWVALTTPVAYTTSILFNPFPATDLRDYGPDIKGQTVYIYGADSRATGNHGWPAIMYGGLGLFWWILSAGPDLDADLEDYPAWGDGQPWYELDVGIDTGTGVYRGTPRAAVLYDATNGTISSGDIIRSNRKAYN